MANTIADVNIDMIGRHDALHATSSDYIYSIGSAKLSTDLYNIIESVNKKYTQLAIDYKYDAPDDPNRFYYRSDHYNFAKNGVPSVFFFRESMKITTSPETNLIKSNTISWPKEPNSRLPLPGNWPIEKTGL